MCLLYTLTCFHVFLRLLLYFVSKKETSPPFFFFLFFIKYFHLPSLFCLVMVGILRSIYFTNKCISNFRKYPIELVVIYILLSY